MPATRRQFLQWSATAAAGLAGGCAGPRTTTRHPEIIDTHTHFYDPGRPQGVPWPNPQDPLLYRTVLPEHYQSQPVPHPVTGTVVVEASAWLEDNQWILDLAVRNPFIVGFVGNLRPGEPSFAEHLRRFAASPLYRGMRIPAASLKDGLGKAEFVSGLKLMADLDLSLDVNGPSNALPDVARLASMIPTLRMIINHHANIPMDGRTVPPDWQRDMLAMSRHRNVFAKVSGLVEGAGRVLKNQPSPVDADYYRPYLDVTWEAFGEDRLVYGSNWPVSEKFAPLAGVQAVVSDYFSTKGGPALSKVFGRNAKTAYRWIRRTA